MGWRGFFARAIALQWVKNIVKIAPPQNLGIFKVTSLEWKLEIDIKIIVAFKNGISRTEFIFNIIWKLQNYKNIVCVKPNPGHDARIRDMVLKFGTVPKNLEWMKWITTNYSIIALEA